MRAPLRHASLALAVAALTVTGAGAATATTGTSAAVHVGDRPGVQLFQWTWTAIAAECPSLADSGFGFVVTSPPQESVSGPQWWTSYQPVSYALTSKLGTPQAFAAMIQACHAAGLAVVTDAVLNHMAAGDGVGTGGTRHRHYDYPGLWSAADFHHCGLTPDDDIANYQDATEVQTCELLNLADLDTGRANVRRRLRQYLADLVGLGVDGLRIDAAKHISADDLAAILDGLPGDPAVFSEVIRGGGEPVTPEQYVRFGRVYEFAYAQRLSPGLSLSIPDRIVTAGDGVLASSSAVSFVENHDTERNGQSVTRTNRAAHRLAEIVLLADDYGLPILYSGYDFTSRDEGPPANPDGTVIDAACGVPPWTCAHRAPHVSTMLHFRATVGAEPAVTTVAGTLVAFARGARGLAVVNVSGAASAAPIATTMPDGRYCNLLAATCAGDAVITVAGGSASVSAGGNDAVVIDVDHPAR